MRTSMLWKVPAGLIAAVLTVASLAPVARHKIQDLPPG